jgi:hypothetical protein
MTQEKTPGYSLSAPGNEGAGVAVGSAEVGVSTIEVASSVTVVVEPVMVVNSVVPVRVTVDIKVSVSAGVVWALAKAKRHATMAMSRIVEPPRIV